MSKHQSVRSEGKPAASQHSHNRQLGSLFTHELYLVCRVSMHSAVYSMTEKQSVMI